MVSFLVNCYVKCLEILERCGGSECKAEVLKCFTKCDEEEGECMAS